MLEESISGCDTLGVEVTRGLLNFPIKITCQNSQVKLYARWEFYKDWPTLKIWEELSNKEVLFIQEGGFYDITYTVIDVENNENIGEIKSKLFEKREIVTKTKDIFTVVEQKPVSSFGKVFSSKPSSYYIVNRLEERLVKIEANTSMWSALQKFLLDFSSDVHNLLDRRLVLAFLMKFILTRSI